MAKKPKSSKPASTAPQLCCAYDKLAATETLSPNLDNPNTHGQAQLNLYAKILRHQGWRKPILVSNQSGLIVTGHGAWLAARREGWDQVPVDYQDFKTPADEYAHLLADNRLPQLADIDEAKFADVLRDQLEGKLDLELACVTMEEPAKTELKKMEIKAPPKMAWVLIGIPLVRFSEINADVERIAKLPDTLVESTVNDNESGQF
jgi:hypothetical protein